MMLDLTQVYTGSPNHSTDLCYLFIQNKSLLFFASLDALVILDACHFTFIHTLVFPEVFPALAGTNVLITCISVDSGLNLIFASAGPRIAVWCLSGVSADVWRIHSTLCFHEDVSVNCMDCKSGLLAVGTSTGLHVFTLRLENDVPSWTEKWCIRISGCLSVLFSPSLTHIALATVEDHCVRIFSTAAGVRTQALWHSRPISKIAWRSSYKSQRIDQTLYSITSDATLRVYLSIPDAPQHLTLHASLSIFPFVEMNPPANVDLTILPNIFWIDNNAFPDGFAKALLQNWQLILRNNYHGQLVETSGDPPDFFARISRDGSVILSVLTGIDHRPPTILKEFKLLRANLSEVHEVPSHFYAFRITSSNSTNIITSNPLNRYELSLLPTSDDQEGLLELPTRHMNTGTIGSHSKIRHFVRSPEGSVVGIMGERNAEIFCVRDRTTLTQTGSWLTADHMAILEGGRKVILYYKSTQTLFLYPSNPQVSVTLPNIYSLFCSPVSDSQTSVFALTEDFIVIHMRLVESQHHTGIHVISQGSLPLLELPQMVIPIECTVWGEQANYSNYAHEALLSIAADGEAAFWNPGSDGSEPWVSTGKLCTGRTGISLAKCSSAKKTAIVVPGPKEIELTIWDNKESEFASGLEYQYYFLPTESIIGLDWTSTPDLHCILAVGFSHHILVLCQQRMSYFSEEPAWCLCRRIDFSHLIWYPINDLIWLTGGALLVGAGHQMFVFDSAKEVDTKISHVDGLFEHVTQLNGPLYEFHPQMILQCLLWGKIDLVKTIIVTLCKNVEQMELEESHSSEFWQQVPIELYYSSAGHSTNIQEIISSRNFNSGSIVGDSSFTVLAERLVKKLKGYESLPRLSENEFAHLLVLIQTVLEVEEQSRSIDGNGLRYLISMRSFYIVIRAKTNESAHDKQVAVRERLRFRDMVWAFHSECQDILLSSSTAACGGKMLWQDAKALGVFLWLRSLETMKIHFETIARNIYLINGHHDPTFCCLFYFALGKVKLVYSLWKQAGGHKEQAAMLKFLANDFTQARWQTAALKNAYTLLSRQRFELAAAFFLLGNSLRDAINVCIKHLNDFQMAVALARIMEHGDDGPIFKDILTNTVLPIAFSEGNRWLGSWAFWILRRRDLAVKILITPLNDIARTLNIRLVEIGDPHYDDPSLALLYSQLKDKTLQAVKGASEISGRTEFNFVLQTARTFCRMGCHALALDLVVSWSFDKAGTKLKSSISSSLSSRGLARRRSSTMIDMDPSVDYTGGYQLSLMSAKQSEKKDNRDMKNDGLKNLMDVAKQDISIPEFDINAFI